MNVLQHQGRVEALTEQDLVVDPLVVLRCDERVFRWKPCLCVTSVSCHIPYIPLFFIFFKSNLETYMKP